jgi:hypothetical protein
MRAILTIQAFVIMLNLYGQVPSPQSGWSYCFKCQQLFFYSGNNNLGICPKSGFHNFNGGGMYLLYINNAPFTAQSGWKWCNKCQSLFFSNNQITNGVCAAGGKHNGSNSSNYLVRIGDVTDSHYQSGWSWCNKCQGLYFSQSTVSIPCPSGGNHDNSGSARYCVYFTDARHYRIDKPNVTQPLTEYPDIKFNNGDVVTISAGGCVQTQNHGNGKSWKRYVNPSGDGDASKQYYHGTMWVPGATPGPVRISALNTKPT